MNLIETTYVLQCNKVPGATVGSFGVSARARARVCVCVSVCTPVRSGSGNAALPRAIVTYKQHFVPSFITVIVIGLESALSSVSIYIFAVPRIFLEHAACNHAYFSGSVHGAE
jgi:hypothetical protein